MKLIGAIVVIGFAIAIGLGIQESHVIQPQCLAYTERGWVRQVWAGRYCETGCDYSVTLEREYPRGELATIRITDSGAPRLWIGDHVELGLKQSEWQGACVAIERGVHLTTVRRLP